MNKILLSLPVILILIIAGCVGDPMADAVDCGSDEDCLEDNLKTCTLTTGTFSGYNIKYFGMKTVDCKFADIIGKCGICEVSYAYGPKLSLCIVPDFILEGVGTKYGPLVGLSLGDKYCTETDNPGYVAPPEPTLWKSVLSLDELGDGYYYWTSSGADREKTGKFKTNKSNEVDVQMSNAERTGFPDDPETGWSGEWNVGQKIEKKTGPPSLLSYQVTDLDVKTIGDKSQAWSDSTLYKDVTIVFVKGNYRVTLDFRGGLLRGEDIQTSDFFQKAVEIAEMAEAKLE